MMKVKCLILEAEVECRWRRSALAEVRRELNSLTESSPLPMRYFLIAYFTTRGQTVLKMYLIRF